MTFGLAVFVSTLKPLLFGTWNQTLRNSALETWCTLNITPANAFASRINQGESNGNLAMNLVDKFCHFPSFPFDLLHSVYAQDTETEVIFTWFWMSLLSMQAIHFSLPCGYKQRCCMRLRSLKQGTLING